MKLKRSQRQNLLDKVVDILRGGNQDFAFIRSRGDQALFGKSTQAMKAQWKIPDSRALADFGPTIILDGQGRRHRNHRLQHPRTWNDKRERHLARAHQQ